MKPLLTEADYERAAARLECEVAAIKAVADVESSGAGFLPDGQVKILFEPHIFSRLTNHRFDRTNPTISYPKWQAGKYGPSSAQHGRLQAAVALDREAALQSASWGKFQVMGFNWKVCGYPSLQAFVNAVSASEGGQLDAMVGYCISRGLADELRRKDWAGFAAGYNGPGYAQNAYDTKLAAAYRRHAAAR